jgi:hypothetical protein
LTLTSGPTGSSETPLSVSLSADGSTIPIREENVTELSAHPAARKPDPTVAEQLAGGASADLFAPTPRENIAPENELDAKDRSEIRATRSADALDLQIKLEEHHIKLEEQHIKLEEHRAKLEWQRAIRYLVFVAGLMALSAAFAFVLKYAGMQPNDVAILTILAFISSIIGYTLRAVSSKVWYANSSRDSSNQRESSR